MTIQPSKKELDVRYSKLYALAAGAVGIAVGVFVLLEWLLDVEVLKSLLQENATMKPNTAVCFILSGIALLIVSRRSELSQVARTGGGRIALVCSVLVAIVGLATLAEYFLNLDLGIDSLLVRHAIDEAGSSHAHTMAGSSALAFALIGMGLSLRDVRFRIAQLLSEIFSLATAGLGTVAMIGYFYGVESLYNLHGYHAMVVHTAALFVMLGFGVLVARPRQGLLSVVSSRHTGGQMARRALPVAVGLPFLLGWLRLAGEQAGWYGTGFGTALSAASNITIFAGVIWLSARSLNRIDAQRLQAGEELRTSEERFRQLADAMPQIVWTSKPDGGMDYYNQRWLDYMGVTPEQSAEWSLESVVHPDDLQHCVDTWSECLSTGQTYENEFRFKRAADGAYRWHLGRTTAIRNEAGQITKWFGTCTDIDDQKRIEEALLKTREELEERVQQRTEALAGANQDLKVEIEGRKQMEGALRKSEESYRDLFENAQDAIYIHDLSGTYISANRAAEDLVGCPREEIVGKNFADFMAPEYVDRIRENFRKKLGGQGLTAYEVELQTRDGRSVPVEVSTRLIYEDGIPTAVQGIARDVTQRKRAEQSLRASEMRFKSAFENSPLGITLATPEGRLLRVNTSFCNIVGYTEQELLALNFKTITHSDDFGAGVGIVQQLLAGEFATCQFESRYIHKLGYEVFSLTDLTLVYDEQAEPLYVMAQVQDITARKRTEETLRESEERYRELVENGQGFVSTHDLNGTLFSVNPAAAQALGYTPGEMVGKNLMEFISPALKPAFGRYLKLVGAEPKVDGLLNLVNKAGEERVWRYRNSRIEVQDKAPYVLGFAQDVTDSNRAEAEMRLLTQRLSLATEVANIGVWDWDVQSNSINWDERMFEIYGRASGTAIDYDCWKGTVVPEDLATAEAALQAAIAGKEQLGSEFRIVRPDGSLRHVQAAQGVIVDRSGKVARVIGLNFDITESRQRSAEREVISEIIQGIGRTSNLSELLELTHKCISKVLYAENCFVALHDRTNDLMHFEFWVDKVDAILPPCPASTGFSGYVLRTGRPLLLTNEIKAQMYAAGEIQTIGTDSSSWMGVPLKSPAGTLGVLVVQHYDEENAYDQKDLELLSTVGDQIALAIERQRAEIELKTNGMQLNAAQQISHIGSWEWNAGKLELHWSDELFRIFGWQPQESGPKVREFFAHVHRDDRKRVEGAISQALRQGNIPNFDFRIRRADKTIRVLRVSGEVVTDETGRLIRMWGTTQDITEQQQIERELKQSEAQLVESQHIALVGSWEWDLVTNITTWSEALYHIYGISREDMDNTYEGYVSLIHPDDRADVFRKIEEIVRDATSDSYQHRIIRPDKTVRYHHVIVKVLMGDDDRVVKLFGTAQDVTDNVELEQELKIARDMALESARLKSEFLANMSHEIRTPMNGVIGMAGLLLDTDLDADQRDFAQTIRSSGDALLTIINDILDFSKIEAGKLQFDIVDFDLRNAIEGTVELFAERAHEKKLEFASFIHSDLPTALRGDPGRLRQVLTNLIGNALKFTEQGEVVVTAEKGFESDSAVTIRFSVTDSGIGISREAQERLFQAFTQADGSTTRKYGGTGLGLSISKQLVELMGGKIGVISEPGKGSTFWFTATLEKQLPQAELLPLLDNLHDIRVLIVDDNATNRKILSHQLTSWGMLHDQAESGTEALYKLKTAAAKGTPYDLAILDFLMPGMDGFGLAAAIKADPEIARAHLVLLTSAGERGDGIRSRDLGIAAYLSKPVRQSQLFDCLTSVMSRSVDAQDGKSTSTSLVTKHTLQEAKKMSTKLILLAEDNVVNQKVATRQLQKLGFRIDVVANGKAAVEAVDRISYDLVFMDCQMPEMDGYEATAEIRRREGETKHTPIVAMTAHALDGDREKCLAAGMDDYVTKPVKVEELTRILGVFLDGPQKETGPAAIDTAAPVDVERMRDAMGDEPSEFAEILNLYLEGMTVNFAQIENALASGDREAIQFLAHTCAGTSANCGMNAVLGPLRELELTAGQGQLSGALSVFARVRKEFARIETFLSQNVRQGVIVLQESGKSSLMLA